MSWNCHRNRRRGQRTLVIALREHSRRIGAGQSRIHACHWRRQITRGWCSAAMHWLRSVCASNRYLHAHAALVAMAQETADVVVSAWFRQCDDVVAGFVFRQWVQAAAGDIVRLCHLLHIVIAGDVLEHCSKTTKGMISLGFHYGSRALVAHYRAITWTRSVPGFWRIDLPILSPGTNLSPLAQSL